MSVVLEFAMFPSDVGESKSEYVSKVIEMIRDSGVSYQLTPMGTIIETETVPEALAVVEKAYNVLEPFSSRVYSTMTMDIRKNRTNRLESKIKSVEDKIGKVN